MHPSPVSSTKASPILVNLEDPSTDLSWMVGVDLDCERNTTRKHMSHRLAL